MFLMKWMSGNKMQAEGEALQGSNAIKSKEEDINQGNKMVQYSCCRVTWLNCKMKCPQVLCCRRNRKERFMMQNF